MESSELMKCFVDILEASVLGSILFELSVNFFFCHRFMIKMKMSVHDLLRWLNSFSRFLPDASSSMITEEERGLMFSSANVNKSPGFVADGDPLSGQRNMDCYVNFNNFIWIR